MWITFVSLYDHVNTFNYKVNDEIIIITNVAIAFIIFKHEENHITHKIM